MIIYSVWFKKENNIKSKKRRQKKIIVVHQERYCTLCVQVYEMLKMCGYKCIIGYVTVFITDT